LRHLNLFRRLAERRHIDLAKLMYQAALASQATMAATTMAM